MQITEKMALKIDAVFKHVARFQKKLVAHDVLASAWRNSAIKRFERIIYRLYTAREILSIGLNTTPIICTKLCQLVKY